VLAEGETIQGVRVRMVRGASVRGVVRDAAGRAVPGAHVSGLDGTILGPRSATTDGAGAFLIEGFFAGEVQVNASVPGSPGARGVATVTVVAGETVEADIVLK
jgi:hypothetical protein